MAFEEYDRLSAAGGLVPVYREMPGDLMTPVSAFRAISARSQRAFLLESVAGGERLARYSFLGRDPVSTLEVRSTPPGLPLAGDALLAEVRARVGTSAADVPGPAAVHRRRRRVPDLRRGPPVREDPGPPPGAARSPSRPSPSTGRWWPSTTRASAWC